MQRDFQNKVGILPHPLKNNYGGVLQNYALQRKVKELGYYPISYSIKFDHRIKILFLTYGKYLLLRFFMFRKFYPPLTKKQEKVVNASVTRFVDKHLNCVEIKKTKDLENIYDGKFKAFIVGSDQVWRPNVVFAIEHMFFDFLESHNVVKFSYAASFGFDNWMYNKNQTKNAKRLISKFKQVSVREDSAVDLCLNNFGVTAEHIQDPTLLLSSNDYRELYNYELGDSRAKDNLAIYILDLNDDKKRIIEIVAAELNLEPVYISNINTLKRNVGYKKRIAPPLEEWIKGIDQAEYVITDSFHGTVFSLIFNKPFLTIGDKSRGVTRIASLLSRFGLTDRLIDIKSPIQKTIIHKPLDFNNINSIIEIEKNKGIDFLKRGLE